VCIRRGVRARGRFRGPLSVLNAGPMRNVQPPSSSRRPAWWATDGRSTLSGVAARTDSVLVGAAFVATLNSCASCVPAASSFEHTIAAQSRVNRYLHHQVVPKITDCWSQLTGNSKIALVHTHIHDGAGRWVLQSIEIEESTLPTGEDFVALRCMRDAAALTSFPLLPTDHSQGSFVFHWTWPVPLQRSESAALFSGAGGGLGKGGCDGDGTAPRCKACWCHYLSPSCKCINVCVGTVTCQTSSETPLCFHETGQCVSGGPWGLVGGVFVP
jgi:hypothetical protein